MLQSGVKQSSHVLRKDGAKSTPKLRQIAVTGTNSYNVTNPSQVRYVSDNNIFPEYPLLSQIGSDRRSQIFTRQVINDLVLHVSKSIKKQRRR
ncbi:unnamed protein product [Brassica napus]|uniref:(rape) hypothetical protein n=1 Tax=Brassica napus TaxID=3708 RepID=A0A816SFN6_BRANA|nr:unnamed protein product [Brassica napus]